MKKSIAILILCASTACAAVREVRPPINTLPPHHPPPSLAELRERRALRAARAERSRALLELGGVPAGSADSQAVSNQVQAIRARGAMLDGLSAIVADTQSNIPETAALPAHEVAGLYVAQMGKRADELEALAPTNTLEYLIGAGMRHDVKRQEQP